MKTGNETWWENVLEYQNSSPTEIHYRAAELEVFKTLYLRMKQDEMTQMDIIKFFKDQFGIGYSGFYTRLRKLGMIQPL